ncbi:MAG: antibiotic biosynthesis monooxygenase [Phycisphaerae bacterium]|nr:antibiotic biosynthesis monooxygenase [Phycisphaerae bacterium]
MTVVREIRVRRGAEGRFELLMGALIAEAAQQPGHLGATVLRPHGADGTYRFVYKFESRSHLSRWHGSTIRSQLFEPIAELIHSDRADEYPGLETWFDLPSSAAPPKWKTTLLSWVAIYALVVGLSYAMTAAQLTLPIPLAALVLTGVVVPLVAYVVGPLLGRLFHGWLHASR